MTYAVMQNVDYIVPFDEDSANEHVTKICDDRVLTGADPVFAPAVVDMPDRVLYQYGLKYLGTMVIDLLKQLMNSSTRSADETLFGRVYVDPLEIDEGFITEFREHTVYLWNAHHDQVAVFTNVTVDAADGTEISYPDLPKDIARGYDETVTISVLLEGPPIQATTYTFTFDGFTFDVLVEGIRAFAMIYDPDWQSTLKLTYRFITAIAVNARYFKEQRRPLAPTPWRGLSATYHPVGEEGMKMLNTVQYGVDKVFVVPIYTEQLYCTTITTGSLTITPTNAYDKFYNLNNNCTHLIFIDKSTGEFEIKEVDTVGGTEISFVSEIAGTFVASTTVIYPGVFSTIQSISLKAQSSNVGELQIKFEEYKKSG